MHDEFAANVLPQAMPLPWPTPKSPWNGPPMLAAMLSSGELQVLARVNVKVVGLNCALGAKVYDVGVKTAHTDGANTSTAPWEALLPTVALGLPPATRQAS